MTFIKSLADANTVAENYHKHSVNYLIPFFIMITLIFFRSLLDSFNCAVKNCSC